MSSINSTSKIVPPLMLPKNLDCGHGFFNDNETMVVKPPGGFNDITYEGLDELTGKTKVFRVLYRKGLDSHNTDSIRYKFDEFGSKDIVAQKTIQKYTATQVDEIFKEFLPTALQAKEVERFLTQNLETIPPLVIEYYQYICARAKRYYNVLQHLDVSEKIDPEKKRLPGCLIDLIFLINKLGEKNWEKVINPFQSIGLLKTELNFIDPDLADNPEHPFFKINKKILNMLADSHKNYLAKEGFFAYTLDDELCKKDFRTQSIYGIYLNNEWIIALGSECLKHSMSFIPTRSDYTSGFLFLQSDHLGVKKVKPILWEKGPCYLFEIQLPSKRSLNLRSNLDFEEAPSFLTTYRLTATFYSPWNRQDPMARNSLVFAFEYDEKSDSVILFRQKNSDRLDFGEGMLFGEELEKYKNEILTYFASSKKEWIEKVKKDELQFSQFLLPLPSTSLDYFRFRMDFAAEIRRQEKENPGSCTHLIELLAEIEEIPFDKEKTIEIADQITMGAIKDFNEAKSYEESLILEETETTHSANLLENTNPPEMKEQEKKAKKQMFLAKEKERKFQEAKQKKKEENLVKTTAVSSSVKLRRKEQIEIESALLKNKVIKEKSFRHVAQTLIATIAPNNSNNNNALKAEVTQTVKGAHQNLHLKTVDEQGKAQSTGVTVVSAHKGTVYRTSYLKEIFKKVKEIKLKFPKK
jgi:hypothetical protein